MTDKELQEALQKGAFRMARCADLMNQYPVSYNRETKKPELVESYKKVINVSKLVGEQIVETNKALQETQQELFKFINKEGKEYMEQKFAQSPATHLEALKTSITMMLNNTPEETRAEVLEGYIKQVADYMKNWFEGILTDSEASNKPH